MPGIGAQVSVQVRCHSGERVQTRSSSEAPNLAVAFWRPRELVKWSSVPSDAVTIVGFVATAGVGISAPLVAARAQAGQARFAASVAVLDGFGEKLERKIGRTQDCLVLWSRKIDPASEIAREALTQTWRATYELRDAQSRLLMRFPSESEIGRAVDACEKASRAYARTATNGLEHGPAWDASTAEKVGEHEAGLVAARTTYREACRKYIRAGR